jgi:hypothetical protein
VRIDQTGKLFGFNISRTSTTRDSSLSLDPATGEFQVSPVLVKKMAFSDTRLVASTPASYNISLQSHLKAVSTVGLTGRAVGFISLLGLRAGSDNSTGKAHELAFSDSSQIFLRSGATEGWSSWLKLVIEDANGNVGIGTSSPQSKLAVNGDMYAKKVKVTQTGWPDFVFSPSYRLSSLYEVEAYISKNGHLPGVVSAAQVEKEGLNLGDNQAALLQKIEELTLYSIQQQKIIDQLLKEKAEQKKLLETLSNRVSNLERSN